MQLANAHDDELGLLLGVKRRDDDRLRLGSRTARRILWKSAEAC